MRKWFECVNERIFEMTHIMFYIRLIVKTVIIRSACDRSIKSDGGKCVADMNPIPLIWVKFHLFRVSFRVMFAFKPFDVGLASRPEHFPPNPCSYL